MIKISIRKNLIYLILLFISFSLRRILDIILFKTFGLNNSVIFSFLMCSGEIVGGFLIFRHQNTLFTKKEEDNYDNNKKISRRLFAYNLIKTERKMKQEDNKYKIYLLIFFASFFDLIEFIILSNFIPKIASLSPTSTLRLCCIMTITSSLFCTFALKFKIGRHQIFSLIILGLCSCIIIIFEFIFKSKDISIGNFIISYLLIICHLIFLSLTDVIERYLVDYNYLNPLKILMNEGIISFILTCFYSIMQNPFKEVSTIYKEVNAGKFILLLFFLILFLILSALINIYKILCNVLYSPMTKSLSSYFLNSVFIIYHYLDRNDFLSEGEKNFLYFFMNLIISIIIDFFGLIYNEFFILNCCGLSNETHEGISFRAALNQLEMTSNKFEDNDINSIDSDL